jgi:hypothetical protein
VLGACILALFHATPARAESTGAPAGHDEAPVPAPETGDVSAVGDHAPRAEDASRDQARNDARSSRNLVPVEFQSEQHLTVAVTAEHGEPPTKAPHGNCQTPCRLWLPVGDYRVDLSSGAGDSRGRAEIEVERPSRVWVDSDSKVQRYVGLGIAVASVAVFFTGVYVLGQNCEEPTGYGYGTSSGPCHPTTGISLLGIGLAGQVPGWILFGTAGASVKVVPLNPSPSASRSRTVSSLPTGMGLRVAF